MYEVYNGVDRRTAVAPPLSLAIPEPRYAAVAAHREEFNRCRWATMRRDRSRRKQEKND